MMTTAGSKGQSDFLFQETIQFCHCFVVVIYVKMALFTTSVKVIVVVLFW